MWLVLNSLTVIKKLLWQSKAIFSFNIRVRGGNRGLFRPFLRILYLGESFFSGSFVNELLLLLGILGGVSDLANLCLRLVVVDSLNDFVITDLTRIFRLQGVNTVVSSKIF